MFLLASRPRPIVQFDLAGYQEVQADCLSLSQLALACTIRKLASYIIIIIDKPSSVHVLEPISTEHAPLDRKHVII